MCVEGDIFPLCYTSFELLRYLCKMSNQAQKHEDMTFSEIDNEERNNHAINPSLLKKQ